MKIAIDAGHGSNTAGKRTPDGYREHYINVKTAAALDSYLRSYGIETVRIGWNDENATDDADVSLSARQRLIKAAGCDYSISCHANAYGSNWNDAQGVETLYHSSASLRKDSATLAQHIQNELIKGTPQKNRGAKLQDLAMCNCAIMGTKASVLCEIGFMTNKYEADKMKESAFCKEQGVQIGQGMINYLKSKGYQFDNITYQAHVQSYGWMQSVMNGQTAGTTGQGKRLEAIKIDGNADFTYQVHVQGIGDTAPVKNGQVAGTTGQGKRVEAICIMCNKKIIYRAHLQGKGWTNWVSNGMWCGTKGESRRLEAVEIKYA